jgi:hypothetical protein
MSILIFLLGISCLDILYLVIFRCNIWRYGPFFETFLFIDRFSSSKSAIPSRQNRSHPVFSTIDPDGADERGGPQARRDAAHVLRSVDGAKTKLPEVRPGRLARSLLFFVFYAGF